MKKHQQVSSIFWMLVGVYFTISGYRLGIGSLHKPGPGLIFFLAALLLTILTIINLVGTFRGKRVGDGIRDLISILKSGEFFEGRV